LKSKFERGLGRRSAAGTRKQLKMTMASPLHPVEKPSRRNFLYIATGTAAAVGVAATAWPFIDQMNPDAATVAASGPLDLDLKDVQPGQQIIALWSARPVFIVNRTQAALDALQTPNHVALLSDPNSTRLQQPPYAVNWHRSIKPEYLVVVGICTHLGCIPKFLPQPNPSEPARNWPGGYFCPCHGSKYDLAGRGRAVSNARLRASHRFSGNRGLGLMLSPSALQLLCRKHATALVAERNRAELQIVDDERGHAMR
jgi:ubiquinol-cytochrome c reductase iron-sulfur subunit